MMPAMNRAVATVIALSLIGFNAPPSSAAGLGHAAEKQSTSGQAVNEISSASRSQARRSSNRAAIGAFLGIAGTIAAIAAAERYRRHYGYGYYPYYGPYPYYRPYRYYGYPSYPYYAPRYYYPRYYRYW